MPKADRHVPMLSDEAEARLQAAIAADPDNPELTDDELAAMRPAAEVLAPELYAGLVRGRGRPKAEVTKVPVKLRLDPGTVQAFRASGPGWQTRVNAILAAAAKKLGASVPVKVARAKVAKAKAAKAARTIPPLNAPIPSPSTGSKGAPRRPTRRAPAGRSGTGKTPSRRA